MAEETLSSLLARADRARRSGVPVRQYDLWRVAHRASQSRQERIERFRHALVHAGVLLDGDGSPYRVCRFCSRALPA